MYSLISHHKKIDEIKNNINNNYYFNYIKLEKNNITDKSISVVMTSSNRSKQTYFTLETLKNNTFKDIQVILVDDSTNDPISLDILEKYPFTIDFIRIIKDKKCWIGPSVNYNIGFKYIAGGKVIIQNAEVCHVGNLIDYINNNIKDETYNVFDVRAVTDLSCNEIIYNKDITNINIYQNEELFWMWYQHSITDNRKLHFLSAMTRGVFEKIKEFSYDYTFGTCFDDDDFILKIESLNIIIKSINHIESKCGGLHLYHTQIHSNESWSKNKEWNKNIYDIKAEYYNKYRKYIEIYKNIDMFEHNFEIYKKEAQYI
jgi:hypothetical protein